MIKGIYVVQCRFCGRHQAKQVMKDGSSRLKCISCRRSSKMDGINSNIEKISTLEQASNRVMILNDRR